jgi:maleylacetoacetate isomerase
MSNENPEFILHTYFRSSCSGRLRIALELKSIPFTSKSVDLLKGEHRSAEYEAINPSHAVPSLQPLTGADRGIIISQSIAALEYLEENYPDQTPLLPPKSSSADRAYVRTLVSIFASDIQPVTNLRILSRVGSLDGSKEEWGKSLTEEGLMAYERLAAEKAGRFSFGDTVTLADVCLVPTIWGAMRFQIDMEKYPVTKRVYEEMSKLEAVKRAHWNAQPDTPVELRA